MQRAVIIVKGEVQRVGYRDTVEKIARKMGLVGFVENLKPYDVRIVVEGEKEQIETFIKEIKIRDDPIINVEDIVVSYEKPTGEFKYFEIRRGHYKEENAERLDLASVHLKNLTRAVTTMNTDLGKKIDNVADKQDKMLEKQDKTVEKLDSFHQDTVQKFDNLRDDYGRISKDIALAVQGIERVVQNTEKLLEKSERDRAGFEKSMDKVANAILALAKSKA